MTHPDDTQGILFIDPSFSKDRVSDYDLAIKLEEDKVSLISGKNGRRKVLLIAEFQVSGDENPDPVTLLEHCFSSHSWLQGPFKSVRVLVINQKVTLVPFEMYNDLDKAHYLSFNVDLDSEDTIVATPVPAIKAECIFAVPGKLAYRINKLYPGATFHHIAAVALEKSEAEHHQHESNVEFNLSFAGSTFFIHVLRSQELAFYNSFTFCNAEEFFYYILNIAEKLNIRMANTRFHLSGNIEPDGELHHELVKAGATTVFAHTGLETLKSNSTTAPVLWHQYADLLKLFFCAL
jgi:hypothetical protein